MFTINFKTLFLSLVLVINFDANAFIERFNSFTLSGKFHNYSAEIDRVEYETREDFNGVSFAIKSIQHPSFYENGDYNFKISPAVNFTRLPLRPTANQKAADPTIFDVNAKRLTFLANAKATIHTEYGQFIGAFGYGPAFYRIDYQGNNSAKYLAEDIFRAELVNVTFFNDSFFMYVGPRLYLDGGTHFVWSIRLGMYWGLVNDKE